MRLANGTYAGFITSALSTAVHEESITPAGAPQPTLPENDARPTPAGSPPTWSESRPELCDTIPWFRSLQGGCYQGDKRAFGFLIDGDSGKQSHLDHEIIITRV